MPSSVTHAYFGNDVYDKLPLKIQNKLKDYSGIYRIACQGADPFMFYHFFIGKKAHHFMDIQKKMHTSKTRDFFVTMIEEIYQNNYDKDGDVLAYLYGFICHYYLDLYTHPFIYYQGGVFDKHDKNTYSYNCLHQRIEYMIDLYFIKMRTNASVYRFKNHQFLFSDMDFSWNLEKVVTKSMEIYGIDNIFSKYKKSLLFMKWFNYLTNYDPYGIKLLLYSFIDKVTPNNFLKFQELSYHQDFSDVEKYMNLEHLKWCYPWDKSNVFSTSFLDLYDIALKEAKNSILKIDKMFKDKHLDYDKLNQIFQNLSYITGLKCEKDVKMKYFRLGGNECD